MKRKMCPVVSMMNLQEKVMETGSFIRRTEGSTVVYFLPVNAKFIFPTLSFKSVHFNK